MVVLGQLVKSFSIFCFWIHLILYGYFSFHNGCLLIAKPLQVNQHMVRFLVCTVVADTTNPSRRIEMHIDRYMRIVSFDSVAGAFGILTILTRVATGKGLYTIA